MHCVEMELGTSTYWHWTFFPDKYRPVRYFPNVNVIGYYRAMIMITVLNSQFFKLRFFFFHLWCFIKDIANAIWMVHILPYSPPRWRWSSHNTCLGLCHRSPPTEKWLKSSTWRSECSHVDDQNSCRKNDQESC